MNNSYIIAGPCAAESMQQVLATAEGIARCKTAHPNYTYIYRAGIWKPRTSPDTFQGSGDQGLVWLQAVKRDYQLPVATEVSNAEQVSLAIDAGIDYVWIGARGSANPIAVQTIADAIKTRMHQSQLPIKGIFIKNPVNEDAALWMGNIERLKQTGLPVVAIHRGCNHRPCWQMAYLLRQHYPDLALLMDPSHLSGKADAVEALCMKAQQLGYQGWMIETHIDPSAALSDAQQQISPAVLQTIIERMDNRAYEGSENVDLAWLRSMIDEVDEDLWNSIAKRLDICRQIGRIKKEKNMTIVQLKRYQEIVQKRIAWGQDKGIDSQTITQIMEAIHKESIRVQS